MLGKILEINDNTVIIKLDIDITQQPNLIKLHIVFENDNERIIGEITSVTRTEMTANIVGSIANDEFTPGATTRPSFKSTIRLVTIEELAMILGDQNLKPGYANFGVSNVYSNYKINVSINDFFSNHFSVIGNSGSGKSCTIASIIQKLYRQENPPLNSSIFFFDAYGEYTKAFSTLHNDNNNVNYKYYSTNPDLSEGGELLQIPVWLLDVDDLALLLDAESSNQLPILEKTLKLVPILTGTSQNAIIRKNDIIARALQDLLLSGANSVEIADQVIAVLSKYNTPTLNLSTEIIQPGYTRTLKQCLYVDKTGKMQEIELVIDFIRGYILDTEVEIPESEYQKYYTLEDLELALDFALINEGILSSDKVYDYANVISVRLHSLASGQNAIYFNYPNYITRDEYIERLLFDKTTGSKAQIVNFNINYVDDRLAKVITKVISRMLFVRASTTKPRGSRAFHIVIEEAHRYVQNDIDRKLLGYNIFERITKEGRKYGIFLALITQRPSELSDTCISQCSNFIVLRVLHPKDLNYIKEMVPNITNEIVLQLKNLKPGNCIAFGNAFKVPVSMYIEIPDPRPESNNVDLENVWFKQPVVFENSQFSEMNYIQINNNPTGNNFVSTVSNGSVNMVNNQMMGQGNNMPMDNQANVNQYINTSNNY